MSIKQKNILKILFCLLLIAGFFAYKKIIKREYPSVAMSLSVSSDAKHAISIHHGKQLVLWNLENKTSKLISTDANIYSSYFIPDTDKFIWQDVAGNTVYIENTSDKIIKKFQMNFPSYGQVVSSDLKTYIATDAKWNIFKFKNNKLTILKNNDGGSEYKWSGKLLNLSLIKDNLVSSGECGNNYKFKLSDGPNLKTAGIAKKGSKFNRSIWGCIMLWDINTGKPLYRFDGNSIKTHATLSPDSRYVASGDENGLGFVWDAKTGERVNEQDDLTFGRAVWNPPKGRRYFDKSHLIPQPKDFCWKYSRAYNDCVFQNMIFAVKFINNNQFLRFITHVRYAILYDVLDPAHKKYLKLEGEPSIHGFDEAASISTAPKKNILVMASKRSEGIRVYQFDRKKENLTLVWAPDEIQRTFKQKVQKLWRKLIA